MRFKKSATRSINNRGKYIDIEKVIEDKNPILLKWFPRFIMNYLKRVLHEDEINAAISRNKDKFDLDFVNAIIQEFQLETNVIGEENIPKTERKIIASNHPIGGLEGLALMSVIGNYRKDIKFIVNDILLNIDNIKNLFVPVNKVGVNSREAIRIMDNTYASNNLVLTFPFGLVSRKRHGKIYDLEWKKSFVTKAKEHKRDIVPVHINGRNSNLFYNFSNFRKFIGIKSSVEMLYLIDEMYKQKNKLLSITFGEAVSYKVFSNKYSDKEWAEKLRQHVYQLAIDKSTSFNPN